MSFLSANTTNHRRIIMFAAALLFGAFTTLVFYKVSLSFREVIISAIVGLAVFELLFRTRKWQSLKTLPLYVIIAFILGQIIFYGLFVLSLSYGVDWDSLESRAFRFRFFPYTLFFLIDMGVVTGIAYFLIKVYKQDSWESRTLATVSGAGNEPIGMSKPVTDLPGFLRRYQQQITGFVGWYIINGLIFYFVQRMPGETYTIICITFPANLLALIVSALNKPTRRLAFGILLAMAVNLAIAIILGAAENAWCFVPFFSFR